jgi:hypothetical protein
MTEYHVSVSITEYYISVSMTEYHVSVSITEYYISVSITEYHVSVSITEYHVFVSITEYRVFFKSGFMSMFQYQRIYFVFAPQKLHSPRLHCPRENVHTLGVVLMPSDAVQ